MPTDHTIIAAGIVSAETIGDQLVKHASAMLDGHMLDEVPLDGWFAPALISGAGASAGAEAFGLVLVSASISQAGIASSIDVGQPSIQAATKLAGIGSEEVVGQPDLSAIRPDGTPSEEAFGEPSISLLLEIQSIVEVGEVGSPALRLWLADSISERIIVMRGDASAYAGEREVLSVFGGAAPLVIDPDNSADSRVIVVAEESRTIVVENPDRSLDAVIQLMVSA